VSHGSDYCHMDSGVGEVIAKRLLENERPMLLTSRKRKMYKW
jgi:hypothetical protein